MYMNMGSDRMIKSILVSGRVQGVGFRYATKLKADELGLQGWAENNPDGTVQINIAGDDNKVQQFITAIRNNPTQFSRVEDMNISEITNREDYQGFRIK